MNFSSTPARKFSGCGISALAIAVIWTLGVSAQQPDSSPRQDMKAAGRDTKSAAVDTGHATRKVAHKTASGTKTVAHKTANGTRTAAHKTANGTKTAAKDTAHETQKVGDKIAGKPTPPQ
jgi:hypothetical protein